MILLDASVLIAYLDSDNNHHVAAETLLAGAIEDDLAINSLTLRRCWSFPLGTVASGGRHRLRSATSR